jgi:hypothetical protein
MTGNRKKWFPADAADASLCHRVVGAVTEPDTDTSTEPVDPAADLLGDLSMVPQFHAMARHYFPEPDEDNRR